jgi:hypothetical protein
LKSEISAETKFVSGGRDLGIGAKRDRTIFIVVLAGRIAMLAPETIR